MPLSLRRFVFPALVFAVTFAIQAKLVFADPLLSRDDHYLVDALKGLASVGDYFHAVLSGQVIDLQPLRDLSFALNNFLDGVFGFGGYHLTNWLLWLGIVWAAYGVLKTLGVSKESAWVAIGLYSIHPLFIGSISWVAARKHLLATFFILLATREFLKKGSRLWIFVLYFLSTLSHPLYVLWPLWAVFYSWLEKERRRDVWACLPWMIVVGVLNQLYYSGLYIQATGYMKMAVIDDMGAGFSLLGVGRYFANLVFPARLAVVYYPGALLNLVGLVLLPIACYACGKFLGGKRTLQWGTFFIYPIAIVTFLLTKNFVSDTYAIGAVFGWFVLLAMALDRAPKKKLVYSAAGIVALIFAGRSVIEAKAWESDTDLWVHAYQTEPSMVSVRNMAAIALQGGQADVALQLALQLKEMDPWNPALGAFLGRSVILSTSMTVEQKIALLQKEKPLAEDPGKIYEDSLNRLLKEDCGDCIQSKPACEDFCKKR
jgi:hypothetical protein